MDNLKTLAGYGTAAVLIAGSGILVGWQTTAGAAAQKSGIAAAGAKPTKTQPPTSGNGGNGNSAGAGSPGKALTVTATAPVSLTPGMSAPFVVEVTNPNNQAVQLTEVRAGITRVAPAACLTSWFSITGPAVRPSVQAGQTVPVTLQLTLKDTSDNQDICKGATYSFTFSAAGQSA